MAWSTQELADLAGVSLRAIRHWHEVGLLPQPARLSNGYKQYSGLHLALSLRIARLSRLGFSLDDIADMLGSEECGKRRLRELRAELAGRIAELERLTAEIDEVIALGLSPDLPPAALETMAVMGDDSGSRDVAIVISHVISSDDAATLVDILQAAPPDYARVTEEFERLPADAPTVAIDDLARRVAAASAAIFRARGDTLPDANTRFPENAINDMLLAVARDYTNAAQQRVMQIALMQLRGQTG